MQRVSLVLVAAMLGLMPGCERSREAPATGSASTSQTPAPAAVAPPAAASTSGAQTAAAYAGSAVCAACHAAEAERWRTSHHAQAMQAAGATSVLGDFEGASLTHFGVTSKLTRRGDRWIVTTDGEDGAVREHEIAYTFGVDPLQQYLVPFSRGRLQATSLAWDARPRAQGGARWIDLHSTERVAHDDPLHWTNVAGNWNVQCAECHSTDVRRGWIPAEERWETRFAELSVGCEACHGPGSRHVAWAQARAAGRDAGARDPGLPAGLRVDRDAHWAREPGTAIARRSPPLATSRELDACARCHARRSTIAEPWDHARPFLDGHLPSLIDADLYFDDGQIRDEVYEWGSFLQSRMHAAGVVCSDCHDAHGLGLRAEGNATCARCHDAAVFDARSHHHHEPGSAASACVACHMPARTYMVVDERHDHSLRVPRPELAASVGAPSACDACHAREGARWAAGAIAGWRDPSRTPRAHFGEALAAARHARADALPRLAALARDREQPAVARATALRELAALGGAASLAAISDAARDADPLLRLGAAQSLDALEPGARLAIGTPLLRDPLRAVRITVARSLADVPPEAWGGARRNELVAPLREWRESQALNGDRPESHVALGALHVQLGERAEARREYETARRLAPYFVPALLNLADLEREEGRDDAAEPLLVQALALAPDSAEAHQAMGLLHVRRGRLPEAIAALRRSAELAPASARYAWAHAVALHSSGRSDEALRELDAAQRRRPGDPALLKALVTIAAESGDLDRARSAARSLLVLVPDDPEAQALAAQLERGAP